jgi:general secretion pathway protein A
VARSPEAFAVDPTYLEFFELARSPFAPLADSEQRFQTEQDRFLLEHLEYAAANADSLVVVCGADGSGKSTLISRFVGTIRDRVSCVLIDGASYQGVVPFYSTFLKQIGFDEITGTVSELRNITKEFLVCRGIARDHVLIVVDNTHLADPRILEQLQTLCDIKVKDRRAISVVLFGNADIVRVVDAPAMKRTVFAKHVVFNIRGYSEHETASYIQHRLELAGARESLRFSDAVCSLIHRYSGGIPHRISKLGVDILEEAHRRHSRTVSIEVVRAVINEQRLLPHVTPLKGNGRRRSDARADAKAAPDPVEFQASQERINELASQVDTLETSRVRALQEVDLRNQELLSLRDELHAQKREVESLTQSLANHAAIIAQQNQALSNHTGLFKESESEVRRLTSELHRELRSREAAQEKLDKANATIDELTRLKQQLQATVDAVEVELRKGQSAADQRAVEIEALERTTAHLRTEIAAKTTELESMRRELALQNAAVADLRLRLESQADHAAAVIERTQALSETTAALQVSEIRVKDLAAELHRELRSREAAQEKLDKANATVDELTRSQQELRATVDELTRSKQELQATVDAIEVELRKSQHAADQRVVETEALERTTAHLRTEIAAKTTELASMRSELALRNAAIADLKLRLESQADHAAAITEHTQALSDTTAALQVSEIRVQHLAAELNKEMRARDAALEELDKSRATIAELARSKQELQATVDAVEVELLKGQSVADQRAVEIEALERTTAHLRTEIAAKTTELASMRSELALRNAAIADLKLRLESQSDHAAAITEHAQALSDTTAALQVSEIKVQHLAAELNKEVRARDAALEALDKSNATIAELTLSRDELQATVHAVNADLRSARGAADQRAVETELLERATADLRTTIARRTAELDSMRSELASRNAALADLELRLEDTRSEYEAAKSRIATLKDPAEFQVLELATQKLGSDLATEQGARRVAEKELAEATAAIQELRQNQRELQATARKLDADLEMSRERAFAAYALENHVRELQEALEKRTSELNARSQAVADLEEQVEELKSECEALRSRAVTAKPGRAVVPEPAAEPAVEERTYSSLVVSLYERSLSKIPAYRALKKHDPVFYDGLIKEYQVLVGLGHSDKQINDALRANQAKWMERKLSRASDRTIVAYARLVLEQLGEFLFDRTEPCLSFLVPQANAVKGVVPSHSERTRDRELDVLDMVLTTYDAKRVLPREDDVWPDLEPIFVELFDRFGADNVAAIENSFDANMDRVLLFNVSKTLYVRILALSEPKAAAALRWLLREK